MKAPRVPPQRVCEDSELMITGRVIAATVISVVLAITGATICIISLLSDPALDAKPDETECEQR